MQTGFDADHALPTRAVACDRCAIFFEFVDLVEIIHRRFDAPFALAETAKVIKALFRPTAAFLRSGSRGRPSRETP